MGDEGIGPSTSVLSGQRSTTELIARHLLIKILAQNFKNEKGVTLVCNPLNEDRRECKEGTEI